MMGSRRWTRAGLALLVGCGTDVRGESAGSFGDGAESVDQDAGATEPSDDGVMATGAGDTGGETASDDHGRDTLVFDLPVPDSNDCGADIGEGGVEFSYIWIANSSAGTVSKIDTVTAQEVATFRTRPTPLPTDVAYALRGPSRTSVNLAGDMVVVNRDGFGAVKVAATEDGCVDRNGNGSIDTSGEGGDVLAWTTPGDPLDECIVWSTALPIGSRPAAWTAGNEVTTACGTTWVDQFVWSAAPDPVDPGGAQIYLLDGDDGSIVDTLAIPAADCNCEVFGPYGGAVDGDDNLWTFGQDGSGGLGGTWGYGPLIRVDMGEDGIADYESYPFPASERAGYGIMVDRDGFPWLAGFNGSLLRFDPVAETFATIDLSSLPEPFNGSGPTLRGIQQGPTGDIWIAVAMGYPMQFGATDHGLLRVDATALTPIEVIDSTVLTGLQLPAGVSVDYEGYVWLVDTLGNSAFKIDPDDYSFEKTTGLNLPYTYSDMTGFGLLNAGTPAG